MSGLEYTDVSEAWTRFDAPALDAPGRSVFSDFEFDTTGDLGFTGYSGTSTALPTVLWGGGETWGDGLGFAGLDGVAGAPPARGYSSKESLVQPKPNGGSLGSWSGPGPSSYNASALYDDASRVSCTNCQWTLEDPAWCCKNDCNDKSGGNYRQAYVCADPSDKSGRLTSACEVETECKRSEPPVMCSASKLRELQQYNSVLDAKCAGRPGTNAPYVTSTPVPFYTNAPARPVGRADRFGAHEPGLPWASRMPRGTHAPH
jgi:hypothetical protein